ncbi:FIST N-terminal domain-containing protein [Tumidithrix elongata RA019]|uniref:FIST N-terminal domain-containing protein n=1 Tax=Tumidithrix elongata BACA0141 TaxID=2716417 RepID=A0AAW9PYC3_9CYAN|nr:FIST N-terminal domain-containing protein [Tumidithrix elongata RA019]
MLKIAVGHSNDPDSLEAVNEVLEQCQSTLGGEKPQAGILFSALDFEHSLLLQRIHEVFPDIELIGGTTDGEVSSILKFQQDSLTLMLFCSDEMEIRAAVGRDIAQNPLAIAQHTVKEAKSRLTLAPKLCIAIPESLTTSVSTIVQGLRLGLGDIPIFGGATADQLRVKQTYQFFKTEVLSDSVPILLFAGNLLFSHGIASGWRPIGKRSLVTKVEANTIYEIDGKPALDFYNYYLNDFAPDVAYPLAVFSPGETQYFLRGSVSHDLVLGSITMLGDVPEHSTVQITDASLEDIILASQTSYADALSSYPGKEPVAALFFSCAWRRIVMGTRTHEEYSAIAQSAKLPIVNCGFYTYGEIAPLEPFGQTFFHNTTFVTLLLGSR